MKPHLPKQANSYIEIYPQVIIWLISTNLDTKAESENLCRLQTVAFTMWRLQ